MKKIGSSLNPMFVGLLFICFASLAAAEGIVVPEATEADIKVAAVVRPRHIQFGERARLDLTISGKTFINHIEAPRFNFLPAFLAVPLSSETTPRLESNKITVSMAWAYELIPQAVGDFTLSDIRFAYRGTPYFANPGSIRVSDSDTYMDPSTRGIHQIEAVVDTTTPYLNAPLTYTYRYLYTTVLPTRETPTPRLPNLSDFRVEPRATPPAQTEQLRGKTFWVEQHGRQLYPQKTGSVVIEPAELVLPFPDGPKTLKTKAIKLTVQPLPTADRPADFSGAIGEYQISAQLMQRSATVGNPLALSVRVSGRGNIETVTVPQLPPIPGVIVKGPNPSEASTATSRTYIYNLIASQSGVLRIPAIRYTYFHPSRAAYATTQTTPIPVSVRPSPNVAVAVETDNVSWLFWAILIGVLLAVFAGGRYLWSRTGFMLPRWGQRTAKTATKKSGQQRTQYAEPEPATAISEAREALAALSSEENITQPSLLSGGQDRNNEQAENATLFANALAQLIYQYLERTLNLSARDIQAVRAACTAAQVPEPVRDELVDLLTKCDYHRFAPVPLSTDERNGFTARAESILNSIETHQRTN